MLLKSLLTGVVLAGLAGGVVYFGTDTNIANADVRSAVAEVKSETAKVTENVTANVKDKIEDIREQTGLVEGNEADAEVKLAEINDVPGRLEEIKQPNEAGEIQFDLPEEDRVEAKINTLPAEGKSSDEMALSETPDLVEDSEKKNWFGRFFDNQKANREAARNERAEKLGIKREPALPKTVTKEASAKPSIFNRSRQSSSDESGMNMNDVQDVYDTVLDQTDTIEIVELKDRAYLSLIDYTIRNKAFDKSKSVVPMISQPELRDTARSNIAVGYARLGQRENAFDVLRDVEIDALSDVLRLQVIEAMTAPAQ